MRTGISIVVSASDRRRLEAIDSDRNAAQKHVWRARIILLTAEGLGTQAIMAATGKSTTTVWRWQERFVEAGVEGLLCDKTRPPGKARISTRKTAEVVRLTQTPPPHEATLWTARAMAKAVGLGVATVQRIWAAHGLAPHRWRIFNLSKDPADKALVEVFDIHVHDQVLTFIGSAAKVRSPPEVAKSSLVLSAHSRRSCQVQLMTAYCPQETSALVISATKVWGKRMPQDCNAHHNAMGIVVRK